VRNILVRAAKEAVVVLVVSSVVGVAVNYVRKDGIAFVAGAETFRCKTKAEFIAPEDAAKLYGEGKAFFIDARDAGLFERERIEGAINASPSESAVDSLFWMAAADPNVIAYASRESQRQACTLADLLLGAGFRKVFVLVGGLDVWKAKGFPVEGRAE
jgi:rhodanese-related sulfurtransferase